MPKRAPRTLWRRIQEITQRAAEVEIDYCFPLMSSDAASNRPTLSEKIMSKQVKSVHQVDADKPTMRFQIGIVGRNVRTITPRLTPSDRATSRTDMLCNR